MAIFRPKMPQNHTLWGGTYLYGLHKGVSRPGGRGGGFRGEILHLFNRGETFYVIQERIVYLFWLSKNKFKPIFQLFSS